MRAPLNLSVRSSVLLWSLRRMHFPAPCGFATRIWCRDGQNLRIKHGQQKKEGIFCTYDSIKSGIVSVSSQNKGDNKLKLHWFMVINSDRSWEPAFFQQHWFGGGKTWMLEAKNDSPVIGQRCLGRYCGHFDKRLEDGKKRGIHMWLSRKKWKGVNKFHSMYLTLSASRSRGNEITGSSALNGIPHPPLTTCRAQQGARFIARRPPEWGKEGN